VSITHGGTSLRRWQPIAEQLAAEVVADAPWLARPAFRHSVLAWAAVEARSHLVDAYVDEVSAISSTPIGPSFHRTEWHVWAPSE